MMKLQEHHLNAIRRSRHFRAWLGGRLSSPKLLTKALGRMTKEEWAEVYDACHQIWLDDSPCVYERQRKTWDDCYVYTVRGIRGAYFVQTIDCDNIGPFDLKTEAVDALHLNYLT